MKYPTRFVATAFCALALLISTEYIPLSSKVSAQQETKSKFRPAGPDAKNPRPDEWGVCFKQSLSTEECDQEIDRILLQYDVKLMHQAPPDDDKPARYPHFHGIYIKATAERAKQIAEDEAVESVTQNQELQFIIPQSLQGLLESHGVYVESEPESIEEYRKLLHRANAERGSGAKRPNPGKQSPPKGDKPDPQP